VNDSYSPLAELVLGTRLNERVPEADQKRQRMEVVEILRRLRHQPGVILADEVGMGKTYVALAIACSVAIRNPRGPVIVMVPANLVDKWVQDLRAFCELYLECRQAVPRACATRKELVDQAALRFGVARHSIELLRLLDDPPRERCHIIFLAQGAMNRRQTDKWVRLALIAETLRRHGTGKATRLIQVKRQIHRFLAELLWAVGEERAHDWGDKLWQQLLRTGPEVWKETYNQAVRDERRRLKDDPVPKSVTRALYRRDLKPLAEALKEMPVRVRGGAGRVKERLDEARKALRQVEEELWKDLLVYAQWRSPLLVMDEAHHLKNPGTSLARQLQSANVEQELHTGDGSMAEAFDRMLFLTATPFQLGHRELVSVLERFGDIRWDEESLGTAEAFKKTLSSLRDQLDESQRTAVALQQRWAKLRPEDCGAEAEAWWDRLLQAPHESLTNHQRAVIDAYGAAKRSRDVAAKALQPWIVRHNKGSRWAGTDVTRRQRVDGAGIAGHQEPGGLPIHPQELLPFFLAARSAVNAGQDLLGEALSSSYEAFRSTREGRAAEKDEQDVPAASVVDLSFARWYLAEFDVAMEHRGGSAHPKVKATVRKVVDLWEAGEKVLVFAFYRLTCRALRIHISRELDERRALAGQRELRKAGRDDSPQEVERLIERIQNRYFDDLDSPGRRAIDAAIEVIMLGHQHGLVAAKVSDAERDDLAAVMRRFLRVPTTLVRCFPIAELDLVQPDKAVRRMLDRTDGSGVSWRQKFDTFIRFLTVRCSAHERALFLDAAKGTRTGGIRVEGADDEDPDAASGTVTLANVQVATGETRRDTRARLMRAFNTPFFPDILVCSEVMGEGVDLQQYCRHVIHHDLAWNPSTIEQRTGRIDRLGCKAEGRQPIVVYVPYLAGTADERQYRVMTDREQWFRVVMGQEKVAELVTPDSDSLVPLPPALSDSLSFRLGLDSSLS